MTEEGGEKYLYRPWEGVRGGGGGEGEEEGVGGGRGGGGGRCSTNAIPNG